MKTIFRFLSTGALTAAILAVGAVAGFGQETAAAATPNPACGEAEAAYAAFTTSYEQKGLPARKKTIELGKEFVQKYGSCDGYAPQTKYINENMALWETAYAKAVELEETKLRYAKFDGGIQNKNWDDAYSAGKEIIAKAPEKSLDQMLTLGSIGLYESYNKNNKFADDTIRFAKMSIERMNAGQESGNKKFGVFQFGLGTKENAYSEMNFVLAHLTYHVKGDKKAALPYYYEVSQKPGKYKDDVRVYQTIGAYYFDQFQTHRKDYATMAAEQKDTDTPEVRAAQDAKLREKAGMINAYLELSLDAFGRAHKLIKEAAPKAELYKNLQELYKIRFQKTDGLDSYLATAIAKPLPNPTAPVAPIIDEPATPTTTTTTTTSAPSTAKPAAAVSTKPVSTVTTKTPVAKKGTK